VKKQLKLAHGKTLTLGKNTVIMGILNITPDSFSDGGLYHEAGKAINRTRDMVKEGADIIDIGAESTRPGSNAIDVDEEWHRLAPIFEALHNEKIETLISIDTYHAQTARKAVDAGAHIINDIWGMQADEDMPQTVAETGAAVVIMHNRREKNTSIDIMSDIKTFFDCSLSLAKKHGIEENRIMLDPGIGFGKFWYQNIEIIERLHELKSYNLPLLMAASRKSFINELYPSEPQNRISGTIAAHTISRMNGTDMLRVHDVAEAKQAARITDAILFRAHKDV
jgi:dihydropteroate synthase